MGNRQVEVAPIDDQHLIGGRTAHKQRDSQCGRRAAIIHNIKRDTVQSAEDAGHRMHSSMQQAACCADLKIIHHEFIFAACIAMYCTLALLLYVCICQLLLLAPLVFGRIGRMAHKRYIVG